MDLVSTANNHCFDEGLDGAVRTMRLLQENGVESIGTFKTRDEKRYLVKELQGTKAAFYSLTYGANSSYEASSVRVLLLICCASWGLIIGHPHTIQRAKKGEVP